MSQDELLNQLSETIKALEEQIPANPASSRNVKLEVGLEKSLSQYFKGLENAVDWNALEKIYNKNIKED